MEMRVSEERKVSEGLGIEKKKKNFHFLSLFIKRTSTLVKNERALGKKE